MQIRFLGAAGEVTGSQYLCEGVVAGERRRFLVDCGLFQGGRDAHDKNEQGFAFDPASLDFVVLTHAHLDHSGLLPRLCAAGFRGPIYTTAASLELLKILLPDSAHLQTADRERAERRLEKGRWHGELPTVLYGMDEVQTTLQQVRPFNYGLTFQPVPGILVRFHNAGHILGAAIAVIDVAIDQVTPSKTRRLVFSGDIGPSGPFMMPAPELIPHADVLVVESTYGDRLHKTMEQTRDEMVEVVTHTLRHGGNIVIPAFAVGRTQEVLLLLAELVRIKRLPHLNVFIDSPMATAVTQLTAHFRDALEEEAQDMLAWHEAHPEALRLRLVSDVEESKSLNLIRGGAIIISASGMCEGGRVVHHLYNNLPHQQNAVIITGFQARGTTGRQLVEKARTVRLFGREVPVNASVHTVGGLSAHADQSGLLTWLGGFASPPEKVFVVHGESDASNKLAEAMRNRLGWKHVTIPERGTSFLC